MNDPNLPPDPFGGSQSPDLNQWAANLRGMYTALVAAGFKEDEALEVSIRCMQAMLAKRLS